MNEAKMFRLRLRNCAQVVRVCTNGETLLCGSAMDEVAVLADGTVLVSLDGRIHTVETEERLMQQEWYRDAQFEADVDMRGKCVLPGLVDAHTHPVWSGDRVGEYAMKLAGATYMDIHRAGGGINFSVAKTRASSAAELEQLLLRRLDRMLRHGTTAIEAKSGYGLDVDTEMKMLQVLHKCKQQHPVAISATFLGAHSVPPGLTEQQATDDVVNRQLPALAELQARGEISVENIDVFCERGVFDNANTEKILLGGKALGLAVNFHGDELNYVAAAELGAKLGATAISHLEEISDAGIEAMAANKVVGVLLPTTAYVLRITPPPARKMIAGGVPVALGSDFNPNAHCVSMPFVMNLACQSMRLTMNEALVAATINSAASINKSAEMGSIEVGKLANFVCIDHSDWRHLIYEMVDPPICGVYCGGVLATK